MRADATELILSATDLSNFLGCRHRTALEMGEARGGNRRPRFNDSLLELLFKRGLELERAYVDSLRRAGREIVDLADIVDRDAAVAKTLDAMRSGVEVIVQAALRDGRWYGRPDVMRRIEKPSGLGPWSYEIADTKLSRETRAGTILQLGLYSEMLAVAQGSPAEYFCVVTPDSDLTVHTYRVDDYAGYFRLVRAQMLRTVGRDEVEVAAANYPEPVDHCDVCPWSSQCSRKRRSDDHLSLVAGISRVQRRELQSREVATLSALAKLPVPLTFRPTRGAVETYVRIREQARIQLESRSTASPLHELLPVESGQGLCRLPEPSPGDIFLDLEGDAFAAVGGREYLFGLVTIEPGGPVYRGFWAFTESEERQAFESAMDLMMQAWQVHAGMHVYHYAPYEPSAFKRLMGRHATRERELDRLLRAERFVDLYSVVRQGLRVGVERYSIKNLETLYRFNRAVALADASRSLPIMEYALELQCPATVPREVRDMVEGYNRDDCLSTLHLRSWLERAKADLEAAGTPVPRPAPKEGDASENVDERGRRVAALRMQLLNGVPAALSEQTDEQHARWLLAYLLDWHRREDKAEWWEYFRLRDLPEEDLFDEPRAVAGLTCADRVEVVTNVRTGNPTGSVIDRYRYPVQEMEIRNGDDLKLKSGDPFGKVVRVDRVALTVDVRKGPAHAGEHPSALFAHTHVPSTAQEDAIYRIAERVAADSMISGRKPEADPIARQLLLSRPPRLRSAEFRKAQDESDVKFAVRIAGDLDETVLAIQGPPGSGKTFTGAEMICALVGEGRKVGVTASSHKVILNLLEAVDKAAKEKALQVRLSHRKGDSDDVAEASFVKLWGSNGAALEAVQSRSADVLGGTAWLWARPEFAQTVDVLFVDEAGQMSLADVLAVSHACNSLVLLGDPQQLEQPQKGSHPEGVNASALQHILGHDKTMPPERGIFLPVTWRLPPGICAFTSELFYENRLASKAGLEHQALTGTGRFDGAGLWVVDVDHEGNQTSSAAEIEVVAELVARLTAPGVRWIDQHCREEQMAGRDILVVAPYNAQVTRLAERLQATGVRVGTVDKFQGQEAPVVIYSMATSRPEDAPRGMGFLYSLNRLNVATSRARCAVFLVASPRLFDPECRTARQMKLANALCRYREMARSV